MSACILVVDDEEMMANLLKKRLHAKGYEVILAYDGQAGLDAAKKYKPDLILLDLLLPKLEGYEVCRRLKHDDKYKSIPIVLISALAHDADISLGKEVGADAYLTKPLDSRILMNKIEELLSRETSS